MSADNRTVATDALATLGMIVADKQGRDAIHLAVEHVEAAERLLPGWDVKLIDGKACRASREDGVGIVDPFIPDLVMPGERFWLIVYPRKITSLRHVWSHPAFDEEAPAFVPGIPTKGQSEAWLRKFCDGANVPGYDQVMAAIDKGWSGNEGDDYPSGRNDGDTVHFNGIDASGDIPSEFWIHAENVLGKKLKHAEYFSCSC